MLGGQVILQTFQPEHYVIRTAAGHDYAGFYKHELDERKRLGYPPFGRLVRLEYRHLNSQIAENTCKSMAELLKSRAKKDERIETDILGPVPCFHAKINDLFYWQVVVRGPEPATILPLRFPDGWRVEVDPPDLL